MSGRSERPRHPLGFDYATAVLELSRRMSYEQIAEELGFSSTTSVHNIITGTIPSHPVGEAIWFLYREKFDKKPPMSEEQRRGYAQGVGDFQLPERKRRKS